MTPRPRVLNDFPHPVAVPYSLIFEAKSAADRRWALCFTQYQSLRVVCLPLISQYLLAPKLLTDTPQAKAIHSLNTCIAGLKSPFFTDWVTAVNTLNKHLRNVGITPLFPQLAEALKALDTPAERTFGTRKTNLLKPLDAVIALRNATAHGGLPDEAEAERHIADYLPVLHQVLEAFDFLADFGLKCCDDPTAEPATVVSLRGTTPTTEELPELPAEWWPAFRDSPAVMVAPDGQAVPLFPLMNPRPDGEPLFLYDGHYGIRVDGKSAADDSYVYYLGTHRRAQDRDPVGRLQELLAARNIQFFTEKADTAPWTIADHVLDYTHAALDDLKETGKYVPECYVPYADAHAHLDAFLNRSRATGFVLVGMAGHGKTALLAHLAETLIRQPEHAVRREHPTLVLLLRGNGLYSYPELMLFRNVLEKAGGLFGGKGFGSARELLAHLHAKRKDDRIDGRRLILIVDAINEGPFPERVTQEALEIIREAAKYEWVKVIVSTRWEWLGEYTGKQAGTGATPLEETRPYLYVTDLPRPGEPPRPPVVTLDPPSPDQAEQVYTRYQTLPARRPPCPTAWADLTTDTREVLRNPLHARLFMEVFAGTPAEPVTTKPRLYQRYVDGIQAGKPAFWQAVAAVLAPLLADEARTSADLTDDDVTAIRNAFYRGLPPADREYRERTQFHPVETLAAEGLLAKRVRIDGGGYKFTYQEVAEYLIYRDLREPMAKGEDEFAYWRRLAQRETAFAEYAGAVLFLLRSWEQSDEKREWIGRLIAEGSEWTGNVLTKLLDELARTDFVPGKASVRGERLTGLLGKGDSLRVADSLQSAGFPLMDLQFAPTAVPYFRASADVQERLLEQNPGNVCIADGLARGLNNLGYLLKNSGRVGEAEGAYRRSVEISEELYRLNPGNVGNAPNLGDALSNLGVLLRADGRVTESEAAHRRSVEISEEMYAQKRGNVGIANGLAAGLNNLGKLLITSGRVGEAEAAYRRSVEIREELYAQDRGNVRIANWLALSLNNLGNLLLSADGRVGEAEAAYRRSVEILDDLYAQNLGNVGIAHELAGGLNNLGWLLSDSGRVREAEAAYRRSVEIREELYSQNRGNVDIAAGLAMLQSNLGNLLITSGRVGEAEAAYRHSVEVYVELYAQNRGNVDIASNLGAALNNLGLLLRADGREGEAEATYRRSVEIREELYRRNPGNIEIKIGLADSLDNVGRRAEARQLVNEVLAVVPNHPRAKYLDGWLRKKSN